jgi:hypothetical protein
MSPAVENGHFEVTLQLLFSHLVHAVATSATRWRGGW